MKSLIVLITLISTSTFAANPGLDNISQTDLDNISKEFSANFVHRPVSPASPLGDIFGFEVGVTAGITDAPKIAAIAKREDPTQSDPFDKIAHAGLLGAVSVPFGLTGEVILFPERELGDVTLSNYSLGLKWTFSKALGIPLVDLALRGHLSSSEVSYNDTIDSVNTTVKIDNSTYGATLLASKSFLIIEPFVGIGIVTRDTEMSVNGNVTIFDTNFSSSTSASVDDTSTQFLVGAQLDLALIHIAAQYENVFGTNVTSLKFSLAF